MKRVLYLVQSCNEPGYTAEEDVVRETWGKDAEVVFYKARPDIGVPCLEGDTLYVDAPDDIDGTYAKTMEALNWAFNGGRYNYVVRTNTSHWINTPAINSWIQQRNDADDRLHGGFTVHLAHGPYKDLFFLNGGLLVISRTCYCNHLAAAWDKDARCVDDVMIGETLRRHFGRRYKDWMVPHQELLLYKYHQGDRHMYMRYWAIRLKDHWHNEHLDAPRQYVTDRMREIDHKIREGHGRDC